MNIEKTSGGNTVRHKGGVYFVHFFPDSGKSLHRRTVFYNSTEKKHRFLMRGASPIVFCLATYFSLAVILRTSAPLTGQIVRQKVSRVILAAYFIHLLFQNKFYAAVFPVVVLVFVVNDKFCAAFSVGCKAVCAHAFFHKICFHKFGAFSGEWSESRSP